MKLTSLLFLILIGQFVNGQNLTNQVADSVCICFEEKLMNTENENLNDTLINCIGGLMAKHSTEVFMEHNLEGYTVENVFFIQSKIMERLEKKCEFVKKFIKDK